MPQAVGYLWVLKGRQSLTQPPLWRPFLAVYLAAGGWVGGGHSLQNMLLQLIHPTPYYYVWKCVLILLYMRPHNTDVVS